MKDDAQPVEKALPKKKRKKISSTNNDDLVCEEKLLEAFGKIGGVMKIAVIGNSHLSALKLAWDEIKQDYPDKELVFLVPTVRVCKAW